jgi:CO dehydrogenase nickel-insertion accessory protein CooC1
MLVVEATWQSLLTARRIKRLANEIRPDARVSLVVSKAAGAADIDRISGFLGMAVFGVVPLDEDVTIAERLGVPVFEHARDSVTVAAITRIAERLDGEEQEPARADITP